MSRCPFVTPSPLSLIRSVNESKAPNAANAATPLTNDNEQLELDLARSTSCETPERQQFSSACRACVILQVWLLSVHVPALWRLTVPGRLCS